MPFCDITMSQYVRTTIMFDSSRPATCDLSFVHSDLFNHVLRWSSGWLNAYREGGWLPSWASPGYRNCMVGTYADVVVSDAVCIYLCMYVCTGLCVYAGTRVRVCTANVYLCTIIHSRSTAFQSLHNSPCV